MFYWVNEPITECYRLDRIVLTMTSHIHTMNCNYIASRETNAIVNVKADLADSAF
jgi:hypothetical protein